MKKMICVILALMFLLAGCRASGGETMPASVPTEENQLQLSTVPTLPEGELNPGPVMGGLTGDELPFSNAGKVRLGYEGNRSYVRYVTSVDQLPAEGSWTGYDESYFETKALLIVVETLGSGSVELELEAIRVSDGKASIVIGRTMSGEVGTADMATWMLWAEVDKGLEYEWTLANATQLPEGEKY
jgi:hypothetical protein